MPKKSIAPNESVNPDVVLLPNGVLRLTLVIDKINSEYEGVKVEGKEATYEERREASYRSDTPPSMRYLRECSRVSFTVPLAHAAGYAIGSTVVLTIAKAEGRS